MLWYKDEDGEPIYTYDARSAPGNVASPQHWSEQQPRGFGSRARLVISPHPAQLVIDNVRETDAGLYRCRVDFKQSQTRNSLVTLSIVKPPASLTIRHGSGDVGGEMVGPVSAGVTVTLACLAHGSPPPTVAWYRDGVLLDATSDYQDNVVINTVNILHVGDLETRVQYTCRAHNNNVTRPVTRDIKLDINFPPTDVKIFGLSSPLLAGRKQQLRCVAAGSRPAAVIHWFRDNKPLAGAESVLYDEVSGVTTSHLELILTSADHGTTLSCSASNPHIVDKVVNTKVELDVMFAPSVRLQWGASIDGDNIGQGQDVYLECLSVANPLVTRITWLHNGFRVEPSKRRDTVVISGHSLVIQGVTPGHSGNYSCVVSNVYGDAVSRTLSLAVKYPPECDHADIRSVYLPLNIEAEVLCRVLSHPAPSHWWWTFNNTHQLDQVPGDKYTSNMSVSSLRYTPLTAQDYGVLSCWARNSQGAMASPCRYELVQSSHAASSLECNLHNQTGHSLMVLCSGNTKHNQASDL